MASILADIDIQIESADKSIKDNIEKWIKENYTCTGVEISDKPNKDGIYEVSGNSVIVKNKNITSLTNGWFEWKETQEYFNCSDCYELESLEHSPKEVGGDFDCNDCRKLKSLEGSPKEVGGDFYCLYCDSLTSLEGAPNKIGKNFYCYYCKKMFCTEDIIHVSDVKGKICV